MTSPDMKLSSADGSSYYDDYIQPPPSYQSHIAHQQPMFHNPVLPHSQSESSYSGLSLPVSGLAHNHSESSYSGLSLPVSGLAHNQSESSYSGLSVPMSGLGHVPLPSSESTLPLTTYSGALNRTLLPAGSDTMYRYCSAMASSLPTITKASQASTEMIYTHPSSSPPVMSAYPLLSQTPLSWQSDMLYPTRTCVTPLLPNYPSILSKTPSSYDSDLQCSTRLNTPLLPLLSKTPLDNETGCVRPSSATSSVPAYPDYTSAYTSPYTAPYSASYSGSTAIPTAYVNTPPCAASHLCL